VSIKGALNLTAVLMTVSTGLGSFATFTLFNTYQAARLEFSEMRDYRSKTTSRIDRLEVENSVHWDETQKELRRINDKMDKIFTFKN